MERVAQPIYYTDQAALRFTLQTNNGYQVRMRSC